MTAASVRVVDRAGQPVADAEVRLLPIGSEDPRSARETTVRALTGIAGTFRIDRLADLYATGGKCDPLPAFGVGANPAAIAAETEKSSGDILRKVFGDPVDGINAGSKCQDKIAKRAGGLGELGALRRVGRDGLAPADGRPHGSGNDIRDSARRRWASAREAAPVIHCDDPSRAATRPSRLMAVLATVNARPSRR